LIKKCKVIVLVDGGSNRFYETKFRDYDKIKVILGDLDSAKKEILKYYSEKGV
jgi:thiamine pyrophosphokinase